MNTVKVLREAGPGCCLMLPLLGANALAVEPSARAVVPDSLSAAYPTVGFQPSTSTVKQTELAALEVALSAGSDLENREVIDVETLNLHAQAAPLASKTSSELIDSSVAAQAQAKLGTLLVELTTVERPYGISTLVKGAEDGYDAIAFQDWLIPFDDVVNALGFTASVEVDGRMTLRSPEIVTQIQLESLPVDSDLGVMWSVADIAEYLGASAKFNRDTYTIEFNQTPLDRDLVEPATAQPSSTYAALSADYLTGNHNRKAVDATIKDEFAAVEQEAFPRHPGREIDSSLSETASTRDVLTVQRQQASQELGVLLVGLAIDDITTVEATLVKGREDGETAVDFERWLLPFEDAMMALGASATPQTDGSFAIRAPGLVTSLDSQAIALDPEIGQAIAMATIEEQFGISAEFDRQQYAIKFSPPPAEQPVRYGLGQPPFNPFSDGFFSRPAAVDGLPTVSPAAFSVSNVTQSTRASSSGDRLLGEPVGQVSAVGSLLGGSWYASVRQPALGDYSSWQLKELQYLRQDEQQDYVLGSQPTFWRSRSTGQNYWGATAVRRWGFVPPSDPRSEIGFSPQRRLQANQVGRTVSGEAEPGTFVQLTQGLNGPVVDEVLVNSSGLYRFEDVPATAYTSARYSDRGYLVQLYPKGQLNRQPEIRSAAFATLPGQLPKGASALVASAGVGHSNQSGERLGSFSDFQGGIAYRYGASESLTLGAGLVQEGSPQVLAEGFYLPANIPVQAAFSATVDAATGEAEVEANLRYQPTKDLRLTFDADRFSQRLEADWQVSSDFTLRATGNTRERSLALEARANYRMNRWAGRAIAAIDTNQNLRWRLDADNNIFNLSHQGSEVATYSTASYRPQQRSRSSNRPNLGHELALTYQTFNASNRAQAQAAQLLNGESLSVGLASGRLAIAEWRYRSSRRTLDGQSRWRWSLGYGFSAQRSGPIVSTTIALGTGLDLQMRYQGVSLFDSSKTLQLALVSRLDTQNGLGWGHRRQNELRGRGALKVQPFFDTNTNGVRDEDEALYLDSLELMLSVNHQNVDAYNSELLSDGLLLPLLPNTYRLDIDPAGLPIDKAAIEKSYAVEVVSGQYTTVEVPLASTYTVSGLVIDEAGLAVAGARVEVVSASGHRQQSITNGAGAYYLERLKPEAYELSVNGVLLEESSIVLEENSETFLEKEIRLL